MMSKFQGDAKGTQISFAFELVAIFASCLILSYFRPHVLGPVPVQLTFLALGWGAGWFVNRVGVLLLVISSTAVVIINFLDWWGTPSLEFLLDFSNAILPITAMGVVGSSLRRMTEHLDFFAGQDPLTGLLNQKRFVELIENRVRAYRGIPTRVAIVFLDCDHFKAFNDTHGHLLGDQYLIDIANRISQTLGPHDLAARFGGDEFAILITTAAEKHVRQRVADLNQAIPSSIPENLKQPMSWSIGVAIDSLKAGANEIINAADQAMYTAKRKGPGQIHIVTAPVSGEE
jgi:diguanylate cyclase (GGDEF)-like protein